ncbi:MAG TPA: AAA family ATPase [Candidatus Magasanikbacteria bacterium]|nr:AAA family ATPase [Candidatus Magasanikbacteria bacterium]
MISKISKLKDFGIFHDFSWKTELSDFKRFNLIYGWNRSGKTTISRVFASCEKKCTYDKDKFKQYPENGEFEIKTDDGTIVKNTDVATNVLPIKVFNQDFIDENISFDPSDSCNPIIYVSEEDIESKNKLKLLKGQIQPLSDKYQGLKTLRESAQKIEDNFRISLAQTITQLLTDKKKQDRYYFYDKSKVKEKIDEVGVDNFADKILSDEDKKKYEAISKSEAGKPQNTFPEYNFSFSFDDEIINSFQKIFDKVVAFLGKKVVSETLDRLKNDQILNSWVKQGFDLHKTKEEKEKCLFCQKPLDNDFLATLSKHFSKDYEDLQSAITSLKSEVLKIKQLEIVTKNDDLYPDLKDKYTNKAKELNECTKKINTWIDGAIKLLQEKYDNPLVVVSSPTQPEDFLSSYNDAILELNKIINKHNEKVSNHASEVSVAREKIELNSIATALVNQDYNKMVTDFEKALRDEREAFNTLDKNNFKISELEKQTSNIGKAIIAINKHLEEFFGRKEIELALDEDNKGYTIKRDGKPAKNLSEGEKTAIAFSYFVVKVGEGDFDKSKGIIFIDDPISSFDSNFIYHCFSMINVYFKEVGQLFISTHNFQLFNLVKEWFINKNNSAKKDNEKLKSENKTEKPIPCEFFMVENFTESDVRKAKIIALDKTLRNYKSEYHFLFAKLKEFSEKQDTQYEDFYTISNMARRFFDIFADFKIPTTGDQKSKMEVLVKNINDPDEKISTVDAGKAHKLVNEFSHNSDPTSTIEHKDKSESKDAIKILLNIVKESDPKHFEILEKSLVS